jgi:hypothetical protein
MLGPLFFSSHGSKAAISNTRVSFGFGSNISHWHGFCLVLVVFVLLFFFFLVVAIVRVGSVGSCWFLLVLVVLVGTARHDDMVDLWYGRLCCSEMAKKKQANPCRHYINPIYTNIYQYFINEFQISKLSLIFNPFNLVFSVSPKRCCLPHRLVQSLHDSKLSVHRMGTTDQLALIKRGPLWGWGLQSEKWNCDIQIYNYNII